MGLIERVLRYMLSKYNNQPPEFRSDLEALQKEIDKIETLKGFSISLMINDQNNTRFLTYIEPVQLHGNNILIINLNPKAFECLTQEEIKSLITADVGTFINCSKEAVYSIRSVYAGDQWAVQRDVDREMLRNALYKGYTAIKQDLMKEWKDYPSIKNRIRLLYMTDNSPSGSIS